MTEKINGELEIDRDRGVIYFHTTDEEVANLYNSPTILRICRIHPRRLSPGQPIDLTCSDRHYAGIEEDL